MSYGIFDYFIQPLENLVCSAGSFSCKVDVNAALGDEYPYLSAASQHDYDLSSLEMFLVGLDTFSLIGDLLSGYGGDY